MGHSDKDEVAMTWIEARMDSARIEAEQSASTTSGGGKRRWHDGRLWRHMLGRSAAVARWLRRWRRSDLPWSDLEVAVVGRRP
jgi:hypothetical protein